ncbi:sigma-70 family RNA polymerase sigma factor [Maribacter sp. ACAM166]|uniref:sigma-70 family RNA polymerase sigma factor n=1 Tax=Maribacter sp. ACAM166 TaxID=2508996 RepID=UPI0010FE8536|nr:sigma-70 family RNA polymerase sigma factor [Maribacter sp. ACAM166]TLP74264.1 sigma-70 family RNA polymerase sigma factor [Maribacter sp. ACAM166]
MQDTVNYSKNLKEYHIFVANTFSDLKKLREKGDKTLFNELLLKTLPHVKRYIAKRFYSALSKGNLPQGKYKTKDFLDQLFIEVFDNFMEVKTKKDLYPWLFKIADEVLDDTIADEEFDNYFLKNIDDYSKPEWDEMEEKYSIDGGDELVMIEELDDISYPKNDYVLNHVFVDNDTSDLIAQLDEVLGPEGIKKHIEMVLYHLPLTMQTVFGLATEYYFDIEEIAKIRDLTIQEVKELFEQASKSLEIRFLNRI